MTAKLVIELIICVIIIGFLLYQLIIIFRSCKIRGIIYYYTGIKVESEQLFETISNYYIWANFLLKKYPDIIEKIEYKIESY
jgi:hypothetical protein